MNYLTRHNQYREDHIPSLPIKEIEDNSQIFYGNACTVCTCNWFTPDLDKDSTGFTCKCGHMKSDHWR